jgi:hypothetical protein
MKNYKVLIDLISGRPFVFKNDSGNINEKFNLSDKAFVIVKNENITVTSQDGKKNESIIMSDLENAFDNLKIEQVIIEI